MKKKNLIILLLIPFIIALVGLLTVNISFQTFYGDITSINWDYDDVEAFSLRDENHQLTAYGVNSSNAPLDEGNSLVWKVENKDASVLEPIAKIEVRDGKSYLVPIKTGEVVVTCSNFKGNIFRKMTVVIYDDGVITLQPSISGSQNNVDPLVYYGQYDLNGNNKTNAKINLKYKCLPQNLENDLRVSSSDNLHCEIKNGEVIATAMNNIVTDDAYVELESRGLTARYEFKLVKEGVNAYTYNDLLACTNKSESGEIVVLRKSFESLNNIKGNNSNNVELFGNYSNEHFSFNNEVYRFDTTYNSEYIKQWNEFAKGNKDYEPIDNKVIAGLRVQKDFYGNGYTINMHNLTYPSLITEVTKGDKVYEVPTLGKDDLFRGPLEFYTLGDPNSMPLITAYGQDNTGIYVDGDNITINDINLKNCDMGPSLQFLETVGTVLEVAGDNITIKNSRLANGKNVLRSFSSNNVMLDNSLLSNSMNFLVTTGSNEYIKHDANSRHELTDLNGLTQNITLTEFLSAQASGDEALNTYLMGKYESIDAMRVVLKNIQAALNPAAKVVNQYKGSMVINDTYFYHSGLAAICFETLFNGPFLYSSSPSLIGEIFSGLELESKPIVPFIANNISGLSYPVSVELSGKTKFYDYKACNEIDLSGLIDENISSIASAVLGKDKEITIDDVFPLKPLLLEGARAKGAIHNANGKENINIPVAYYGGAKNLSKLETTNLDKKLELEGIEVDFVERYLKLQSSSNNNMAVMKDLMVKCVTVVTGNEPFEFVCARNGYLYGESPNVSDLIANAKGV